MKQETPVLLPPFEVEFELGENEMSIVKRFVQELESRLQSPIKVRIFKQNQIVHPKTFIDNIYIELTAGNWKRIATISPTELEMNYGQAFYYFMRRMADETMADLLIRGARSF